MRHVLVLERAHVVVVEEAEFRACLAGAVDVLDRLCQGGDVAGAIHHREMRRFAAAPAEKAAGHVGRERLRIVVLQHLFLGHLRVEVRIEWAVGSVDEGAPDRLGQQYAAHPPVDVTAVFRQVLVDVHHLDERPAGAGGRHGEDPVTEEPPRERPPLDGLRHLREVVQPHQAVVTLHVGIYRGGDLPRVEVGNAVLRHALQRGGQCRLAEAVAGPVGQVSVAQEERRRGSATKKPEFAMREGMLQQAHFVPLGRRLDGGPEQVGKGQGPVGPADVVEHRRRARDGRGAMAAPPRGDLAVEHVGGRAIRGARRAVEGHGAARRRVVKQKKRLAAEAGRGRFDDAECERGGYRGIESVAAGFEHLYPCRRGAVVGGRHHAAARHGEPLRFVDPAVAQRQEIGVDRLRGRFPRPNRAVRADIGRRVAACRGGARDRRGLLCRGHDA